MLALLHMFLSSYFVCTVSNTFGTLVRLMPLEAGYGNPPDMPDSLIEQKRSQRKFLEQLMDISKLQHYTLPIKINATLRSYQQTGVDWMMFLNQYVGASCKQ